MDKDDVKLPSNRWAWVMKRNLRFGCYSFI